jgi:hypothetical protein
MSLIFVLLMQSCCFTGLEISEQGSFLSNRRKRSLRFLLFRFFLLFWLFCLFGGSRFCIAFYATNREQVCFCEVNSNGVFLCYNTVIGVVCISFRSTPPNAVVTSKTKTFRIFATARQSRKTEFILAVAQFRNVALQPKRTGFVFGAIRFYIFVL